jgi:hypothetical protein
MKLSLALLFVVAFFVVGLRSSLAHDHWINHGRYASPKDGMRCCGENDCFVVPEESVRITAHGYALASGEQIPFREALVSEDGRYWRCQRSDGSRRCFFAPPGEV